MAVVRELQKNLEELEKAFQAVQTKQQQFLEKSREDILYILKEFITTKLSVQLEEHFENRTEILEDKIRGIDEAINSASYSHEEFVNLRYHFVEIFNNVVTPEMAVDDSDPLVAHYGTSDFQALSRETKEQVLQINEQQERYEDIMSHIEEEVLGKTKKSLHELELCLHRVQKVRRDDFDAISNVVVSEIEKHSRLNTTFQIMQNEMDSLSESLQIPL